MDKFGVIDLHSNNRVVVVSDEADRVMTSDGYRRPDTNPCRAGAVS